MNHDLTNSTSQVNDPAVHLGQSGVITWPNSIQASQFQLSHLRAPSHALNHTHTSVQQNPSPIVSAAPPPYVCAVPCPYVSAAPRPYVSAAPRPYVSAAPCPYVSAAPRAYVGAAPRAYVGAAPRAYVGAAPHPYASAAPSPYVSAAAPHPYVNAAPPPPVIVSAAPHPYVNAAPPPPVIVSAAPHPYVHASPRPYVHASPRPYVHTSSRPYVSAASRPYDSAAPRPYDSAAPHPYDSAAPRPYDRAAAPLPYVHASPRPYVHTSSRPYVSAAPHPYDSAAPHPYDSAAPRPYDSAAPRPYDSAAPRPYDSAAPRPYDSAAPRPYDSAAAAPCPYDSAAAAPRPYDSAAAAPCPYDSAAAAPSPYVHAAPPPYVHAAPPPYVHAATPHVHAAPPPHDSAALTFTNAPQVPLGSSNAAAECQAQNTAASKKCVSSSAENNKHASSRKQALVGRPDFSFADSHEGGHKLQNVNASQITSNDSHQFAPFISRRQTLRPDDLSTNSISVSGPKVMFTQESQMCIWSAFSLASSHFEHRIDQHETESEAGHIAKDNSSSQPTLLERPVLHVHQENKTVSAEKEHDTVSSQFHTTLSTKQNQYSTHCSALNNPVRLSRQGISSNSIHETNELLHQITTGKNNVSVEVSSPKDDSQLLLGSDTSIPTSAAHQLSTSVVTSIRDVQLPVSQENGSIITETKEEEEAKKLTPSQPDKKKKSTGVLTGEETDEKSASLTESQDSSSTSQMLPFTSKVQEPEIVDLDIEDIDDCMLMKIELIRHHFPYGSKINNSEVVIDDSDNDEDVVTKETSVSSGETCSGKRDEQKSSASSTAIAGENDPCGTTGSLSMEVEEINAEAMGENDPCGTTGSLSMEVEEINAEAMGENDPCGTTGSLSMEIEEINAEAMGENDPCGTTGSLSMEIEDINIEASKTNSEQTAATYTMSSTGQTHVTSVINTRTKTQLLSDQIYPEGSCSMWHASQIKDPESGLMDLPVGEDDDECDDAPPTTVEYASLKLTPSKPDKNISTPVIQSMHLQVDDECDDTPPTTVEYESLNVLTPSQPDNNVSTPVIQSVFSSSSLLGSTLGIPILRENYCNPFFEPAIQGQVIENTMRHSVVPLFSSPKDVRKGQVSQVIDSSKVAPTVSRHESHHMQLNGAIRTITNPKHLHKVLRKEQAKKSTTQRPKGKSKESTTTRLKERSAKSLTLKIKIPSAARIQKKSPSHSDINSKTVESTLASTETDSSLMCKLCFLVFSSQMELVTHMWSLHRSSQFVENLKCDQCGKGFANNSLLKLHKKVKCTSSNTTDVDPGKMVASLDSMLHTIIKQNKVTGAPEVSSKSATFRGSVAPRPSTAGLSSDSAAMDISDSTPVDVSSASNSFPERNEVVSNYSAGVVTQAANDKHSDLATGDKRMSEELMQEDIKPIITSTGELLQRSDGPEQVLADGHPSVTDSHTCTTCQMMFLNSFQLSLHQKFSEGCKMARNDCVRCFVCPKTFTSSVIRYLHVLNNPECKEKVDRYCSRCSHLFNSLADKQAHICLNTCRIYEESIMKDVVKDHRAKNVGRLEQNVKEPGNQLRSVLTACEISHPDNSPDLVSEVVKKISASEVSKTISALDRINVLKPVDTPKSPGWASTGNIKKSSSAAVTAFRNVFSDISSADRSLKCKVCGAEFISKNELTHHTEQKCGKLDNTKAVPQLKNLRVVLSRVSVMCQVCHLPFADDIRLAEHLHLNQPCQKGTSEKVKRVLELKKSHLDIDTLKRDGKKRSCEIVTGISSVTSNISMTSTTDVCITLAEQVPAVDDVINEKVAEDVDGHISSNSCANKQSVYDQGNADDESKGHADDNDKDELISSMSSSDEGSDMEESGSSSEEGDQDYTCKQCCKTYASKSRLIKHNKSHHQSAHRKRTHCKVCTRKFHDLTGLQAHLLQFKFCFIPLTRPLWERKQDPHICSMCKKVLGSPKDLRKHCFKKMTCRLRYVNLVLENMKQKDYASVLPAAEAEKPVLKAAKEKDDTKVVPAAEAEIPVLKTAKEKDNTKVVPTAIPVLKTVKENNNNKVVPGAEAVLPKSKSGKENCESQSMNEVSSSVQDYCNPVEVNSSNSDMDFEDGTSCIKISNVVSKPLIECLNCSGYFDDFQEHLLKQQSCLDFFGIHADKCPVPVPFCYQCKTHFDDIVLLQLHACKGLVAYTHVCQTCGLKFTSVHNLRAHVQQSLTCNKTNLSSTHNKNHDSDSTFVDSSAKNQQGGSPSAVRDVPTSSDKQFFHCLMCVARFPTLRLLMEHSYQHVDETPIPCARCSITFLHYNQFVSHQAFHIRMDKEANSLV